MLTDLILNLIQLLGIAVLVGLFVIVLMVIISIVYIIVKQVWLNTTEEKEDKDDQA